MNDKNSNNKHYFTILAAILILVITVSVIFIVYISYRQKEGSYKILKTESENISRAVDDEFAYYSRLSRFIGEEIVMSNKVHDLKSILSLFSEVNKLYSDSGSITWSSFNWIDNNYYELVNSRSGIQKNPSAIERKYIKDKSVINNPWVLYASHPSIGIPSNTWAIPVGMGIADKNGNFLGVVTFEFEIMEFENKIQKKLSNGNLNFVVIDNDANIILQSSGNITKHSDDFYKKNNVVKKLTDKSGRIKDEIKMYDIKYSYYQKMDNYPYIILTGFNQSFLDKEFNDVVLPRILEFILIVISASIILLPARFGILKK